MSQPIRTLLIDPPWNLRGGGKVKRGADRHYKTLKTKLIPGVIQSAPQWDRVADDCHLYLWVINNYLANGDAHYVAAELGFRPVTLITWVKTRFGTGKYFNGATEHILFCVKGKPGFTKGTHTTILGGKPIPHPRDQNNKIIHSRKPVETYEMIEEASPGGYLEIFARVPREGWESFGDQL